MDKNRKKELKLAYKELVKPMGVYRLKNMLNGKLFVESTNDLNARFNRCKFQLQMGVHENKALQNDWKKDGENNFTFEILETLEPSDDKSYDYKQELEILEELWLERLQPYGEKGYNKKVGGRKENV